MPNLGNARTYSGPNGADNFISDNPRLVLTRDVNDRVMVIDLYTVLGVHLRKTLTRNALGSVDNAGRWVRI